MVRIWFMQIFARPKKKHEPRKGCKSSPNSSKILTSEIRINEGPQLKNFYVISKIENS